MKTKGLLSLFCAILLVCLVLTALASCVQKPNENNGGEQDTEPVVDNFTPATDTGEDSAIGKEYLKYASDASGERKEFSALTDDDLEYEKIDGGIKITKYTGEYAAVTVPESIEGMSVVAIGKEAFAANRWLIAVILPESVKTIESLAFYGCTNLCYVDLGRGAKTVENYAFSNCPSLFALDLTSAESLGIGVLFGCNSINSLTLSFVGGSPSKNRFVGYIFGAETADHNAEFVPESLRKIILSDECRSIPDRAFYNGRYITEVFIPDSVESIGVRAFSYCRSISEMTVGGGTHTIGDDAFFGCDNLKKITLPESLKVLGMQAFFACSSLESITLPNSLSEIKSSTFYGCTALLSVDLANVKKIGKDAFKKCDSLTPPDVSRVTDIAEGNEKLYKVEETEEK